MLNRLICIALLISSNTIYAVQYECLITKKLHLFSGKEYTKQELSKGKWSVSIAENEDSTFLSRCSYAQSVGKVTCDQYPVDKVVFDNRPRIKKYYVFGSQFDVQLFSDLTIIENNGRGGIAVGNCNVVSP